MSLIVEHCLSHGVYRHGVGGFATVVIGAYDRRVQALQTVCQDVQVDGVRLVGVVHFILDCTNVWRYFYEGYYFVHDGST